MKLTMDQRAKAVDMALKGENPLPYLKKCGCANPSSSWNAIKMSMKKNNPETYTKLPDSFRKKTEVTAKAPVVKLSGPIRIETPEAGKVEVVETPEKPKAPVKAYTVTGIRVENFGEFYYDRKFNSIDWRTEEGDEISLPPIGWKNLMQEMPDILKALGVH